MVEWKSEEEVLGQHDLVALRRDILDDRGFPRPLGEVKIRQLVVEAAVPPVLRQVLDDGVDDFKAAAAERVEQAPYIGNDAARRERVELGLGLGVRRTEGAVLYVYDEERCAAFDDRPVAGEGLSHDPGFAASLRRQQVPQVPVLG